jgi:hypothetical protein
MNAQRSIRRRVRKHPNGVDLAADINAEIAVNTGGSGQATVSRSVQSTAITQTSKRGDQDDTEEREKR